MNKKVKWLIASAVAGLLVIAIAIPVFAAGPNGGNGTTPTPTVQPGYGNCQGLGIGIDDAVTKLLGMTSAQIAEQRQAGKSLVQIAATKNVTEAALVNAILADRKADLQKLVTAGTLTQAQADQRLEFMKQQIQQNVNRATDGPPSGRGMMGGFGGNCGMGGNNNTASGAGPRGGGMMRFGR
jgi:hypothetical protein